MENAVCFKYEEFSETSMSETKNLDSQIISSNFDFFDLFGAFSNLVLIVALFGLIIFLFGMFLILYGFSGCGKKHHKYEDNAVIILILLVFFELI